MRDILYALATWRLSYLLITERAPFALVSRLRYAAGVRTDESGKPYATGELSQVFTCIYCMSVWVGVTFAFWRGGKDTLARGLAYSACACLIERVTKR